ncbi:hypothetical protein UPYG_G00263080 [Umbra pygmaea]|uniref:Translin-associated factor X-interacting protein 1 N-terminal domain-containing protein n=1 Tax=Umbra pygmaea TaxID=75934 RepID=A0ABD0WWU8_UMBPY
MLTQNDMPLPPLSSFERQVTSIARLSSEYQCAIEKRTGHQSTKPECSDEFGGSVLKPRFLKKIESYLKRELHALDPQQPKFQEHKLQVYREVFDCFIEDLKTYKPLLSAIKNEYEITLVYLRDQIRELEPLRSRLALVSEQCEQRILGIHEEVVARKQESRNLQKIQYDLQTQMCYLKKDLASQYLKYREERDARKRLISNIVSMRYDVEFEDPVKNKLALKLCRDDLTKAQLELNRLHAEYEEVVPRQDWETLDHTHKNTLLKLERMQKDFDQMKAEYDTLLEVHKQVTTQRDSLQRDLDDFREACTCRAEWKLCADAVGGSERWAELLQRQSSQQRLDIMLAGLGGKISSLLSIQDLRDALKMAFPLKKEQDIDMLVTAALVELDNNGGSLQYQRVCAEDAVGRRSLVKKQILPERHMYSNQLRTQMGGKAKVTVEDLRVVFRNIDLLWTLAHWTGT